MNYLDEIVGQRTAKKFVATAIKKGNLYNFLLAGPKGVGKRIFGFALAKTIGCSPGSPDFILLGPIPSKLKDKEDKIYEYSRKYLPGNARLEIEDRESILIEQIRSLIAKLAVMPQKDCRRVVLIVEADKMTQEAANCFLKTLEEPPIDTVFVLTSSRPNYLLPTIRSRCQVVLFSYLSAREIGEVLTGESDAFILGSPGEIIRLRDREDLDRIREIFRAAPLGEARAASIARELEHRSLAEFFYPLMLMYRLSLYGKLAIAGPGTAAEEIAKKTAALSVRELFAAVQLLNDAINSLEQNPNRLLLLLGVLLKLP